MESVSINKTAARLVVFRVRRDRRVRRRRSARCEQRGVNANQGFGVAKLGTDGPARRSRLLGSAWWTGPPPIPRRGPTGHKQDDQTAKTKPPAESCSRILDQSLGQREPALQGTGRSNDPARWLVFFEGGLDDPRHSRQNQLTSHRTPDPNVDVPRYSHSSVESGALSFMR
jgi:hypothetical protein